MERLTPAQKRFLFDILPGIEWTEYFPSEARTAKALAARGLIEVNGVQECRLTVQGAYVRRQKLAPKFSLYRDAQTPEEWEALAKFHHVESGEVFKAQVALADELLAEIFAEEKASA